MKRQWQQSSLCTTSATMLRASVSHLPILVTVSKLNFSLLCLGLKAEWDYSLFCSTSKAISLPWEWRLNGFLWGISVMKSRKESERLMGCSGG